MAEGRYWALTTITTVGYGDLSPGTTAGRFLAGAVMLMGIGLIAVLTGAVAELPRRGSTA
jgi:voltage-gated potassium channel